ncbi:glyoxalase [Marivirga tractuosa]|uniref:Glyoxalase/bleomycin resistance protein/dioxygenase n=1 Tax=Marivirga tractuosa (strain ATCC 23168 / DSM 4126 / NBRC 15989 / NCIMB 1408 / VKM B-1430 / H-43) TaxID=643867 RepID=E4TS58_MARTH|nr:VOC family protein [Marivirga tractuosa]ADR21798.1 Glyoxalase/bleomycin resistance protein/dioxygenase [Marivirga tractuosa DSM 4126]BDD13744.1 glyoxalase [Marivirga tractuosa]
MENYKIPAQTRIGHVHLKVSDLEKALDFYHGLLGFEIIQKMGDQAAFISAGGYHHHIGLNTWQSRGADPAPDYAPGLFHTAIVYPTRKSLAEIFVRLREANYKFTGAADHGVSEALYLNDPDENGVELYWDRPKEEWPRSADGKVQMYTRPLNIEDLTAELGEK